MAHNDLQVSLLEFMRDHILPYTDDTDKAVRQAAALACCRVLERHAAAAATAAAVATAAATSELHAPTGMAALACACPPPSGAGSDVAPANGTPAGPLALGLSLRQARVVEVVVGRLIMSAVADTSERVRRTVLEVRWQLFFLSRLSSFASAVSVDAGRPLLLGCLLGRLDGLSTCPAHHQPATPAAPAHARPPAVSPLALQLLLYLLLLPLLLPPILLPAGTHRLPCPG